MTTGIPISLAIFLASLVLFKFLDFLLPKIGNLKSLANFKALLLLPNSKIDLEEGPINFTLCELNIFEKIVFEIDIYISV